MAQDMAPMIVSWYIIEYLAVWLIPLLTEGLTLVVWSHFNLMFKRAECLCIYFWEWDDWNLSPDAHSIRKF